MKKLLIALAILFAFPASASIIPEGAIVKTVDNPDVYIVKCQNGKQYRRLVLNPLVFQSYGHLKWEDLLTIPQSEMDSYITSDLVRVDGATEIYQLVPEGDNGSRFMLTSTTGYDLSSVYTINGVDFGNYEARGTVGESAASEEVPVVVPTISAEDLAKIAELTAKTERLERANAALEKLAVIIQNDEDTIAALDIKIQEKDVLIEAIKKIPSTSSGIISRIAKIMPEYNALVAEREALTAKKDKIVAIILEIDDYTKYGTIVPAVDRAYLAGLGVTI